MLGLSVLESSDLMNVFRSIRSTGRASPIPPVPPESGHAVPSMNHFQAEHDLAESEFGTPSFTLTPQLLEQSRLNELESRLMALPNRRSDFQGHPRFGRMRSTIDQQLLRSGARRTSVVEVVDLSAPPETMPNSPVSGSPPRPSTPTSDVEYRSRSTNLIRTKHIYSSLDDLRLARSRQRLARNTAGASPGALYVTSRRAGVLSEVFECHGFCYSTPITVRISAYPIMDEETLGSQSKSAWKAVSKALSKDSIRNRWSKICMESHGMILYCPIVPFSRMLKMRQSDFFLTADSGDVLLEGSTYHSKSQYIQYKTRSIASHVSVIYKDPGTGLVYALTSRQWSRTTFGESCLDESMLDLSTFRQIDGIQMYTLEEYMRMQRERGIYFICRRLRRGRRSPSRSDRSKIGTALYKWYSDHHGAKFPALPELRSRIKERKFLDVNQTFSFRGRKLLDSETYTSSQVVSEALQFASILDPSGTKEDTVFSIPGYFEQKGVKFAPNLGSSAWSLEILCLIMGDTSALRAGTGRSGSLTTPEIVRYVESGAV